MEPDSPDPGDALRFALLASMAPTAAARTPARPLTADELQANTLLGMQATAPTGCNASPGPNFQRLNARSSDPERQARYAAMVRDLEAFAIARQLTRAVDTPGILVDEDVLAWSELPAVPTTPAASASQARDLLQRLRLLVTPDVVAEIVKLLRSVGVDRSAKQVCLALDATLEFQQPSRVVAAFLATILSQPAHRDAASEPLPERSRIITLAVD